MPQQHAPSDFVWSEFDENNVTGWSGGIAFLAGVLNGAFTIGTPDAVTHMVSWVWKEMFTTKSSIPCRSWRHVGEAEDGFPNEFRRWE